MRFAWLSLAILGAIMSGVPTTHADEKQPPLAYQMKKIDGKSVDLADYKGKVVLIVNVASQCGLTPQYSELQSLHEKYQGDGLAILGFPCNQFGAQEPGTEAQIAEFCDTRYGVKFDMFSKVDVNGETQCDLYKFLTSDETNPKFAGPISWNFEKFLVSRDGKVVQRFSPRVKPSSEDVVSAIEAELKKKR